MSRGCRSRSVLGTDLDNVFPTTTTAAAARADAEAGPRLFRMGQRRPPRREDGDYNLEAFVSAERRSPTISPSSSALAVADPARRMIGQHLIDLVDEAGYLRGDLAAVAEKLGAPLAEVEAVLAILQSFDPPGVCARNLAECLAIQLARARPLRPGHAGAGRPSRSARQARLRGAAPDLRRRRRRPCRHDRRRSASSIRSPASPSARRWCSRSCPTSSCGRRRTAAGWSSSTPTRCRRCWSTRATTRRSRRRREERRATSLSRRLPADRDLAGARARPARPHHPQSRDRDRAPAGRVLRARRPASAAAQSQDRRRRHQHARIDGLARHRQQIHGDHPRHLRAEIFLHLGDRGRGRRRGAFGRGGAPPHPAADRRREPRTTCCPTTRSSRSCATAGIDIARRTVAKYREAMRIPSSVQRRREKQAAAAIGLKHGSGCPSGGCGARARLTACASSGDTGS